MRIRDFFCLNPLFSLRLGGLGKRLFLLKVIGCRVVRRKLPENKLVGGVEGCYDDRMTELVRSFIDANRVVIFFIYGQVFFVLGLVIALQSWRHSRLALARSLKWLAAFAFLHSFHEWGDVFIPIQANFLATPFVDILLGVQVILLALSFACLFQFGLETLRPLPDHLLFLRYLPGAALALWVFCAFGPTLNVTSNASQWATLNNILARYMMGFTGAFVAAYGLRRQAHSLIAPMKMPHIWRMLQIGGLTLAAYGIMGGLVVPLANFFPANIINDINLERFTLVPVQLYRSILGFILILVTLRVLEVFQVELDRQISSMEEAQMVIAERERIGRELHDGTLQTIYAAGLLLKTSQKEVAGQPALAKSSTRITQTIELLDQAVADIRAYIGALRDKSDSKSLVAGLQELTSARHLRSLVEFELHLDLPEHRIMSPARIGHLLAITNEALSNVARHAQATRVQLSATSTDNKLLLKIADNGLGLPVDYVNGYGLRNMRERARMLGGEMRLDSTSNHGTIISVEVPWGEDDGKVTPAVS
jgi:signal transduction histidine kinase